MTLSIKNLSYKNLIKEMTLTYKPGFLYGILGPNGAGKSTLLKTIANIWEPTSGSVFWNEKDLLKETRAEISRTVSLVPQNPQLQFDITAHEMVTLGRYAHLERQPTSQSVEFALNQVDAWQLRKALLSELSGGEKQRIYIARALATEAPVILLDEPTAHLDLRHQLDIWKLMRQLAEQGKIIIAAVHDLAAASRNCDQVQIIHQGCCVAQGTCNEVLTERLLKEVFGLLRNEVTW
jgi:ABC-type cobalamin/Fe3+-siderophores transport system ATPase subunit